MDLASAVLRRFLFGMRNYDPVTYLAVVGLLTVVSVVACYLPARRASSLNPVAALRDDR